MHEIRDIEMSVRLYNCLNASGIKSLEKLSLYSANDLLKFRYLGKKSLDEAEKILAKYNLKLREDG